MLVRIVLVLGVGLILFSGGAMGWQYWKQMQPAVAEAPADGAVPGLVAGALPTAGTAPVQTWLISPGGGLVDRPMVAAFLRQDRYEQGRVAHLVIRAPLATLLSPGEQLPAEAYRQVFADIRATLLARDLCQPMLDAWASGCALAHARADGYDPATGTAAFHLTLAFAQKPGPLPLPDLSSHALHTGHPADADLPADSVMALWSALVNAARADCAAHEAAGQPCRITGLDLVWTGPGDTRAIWQAGWLAPLPKGMYPAPPLY
jgi:hypothetical protein